MPKKKSQKPDLIGLMTQGSRMHDVFSKPDRSRFVDPFDDRALIAYYDEVIKWHGYIKFLGMPHLGDNPDIGIERLYIEPCTSNVYMDPDAPVDEWPQREALLRTVADHPHLVLLGDPGSGKSTLVSWLAWQFSRSVDSPLTQELGRLVPFPLVLRELAIGRDITWDKLLDSFLSTPAGRPLGRKEAEQILERGQALIMLDGLDEIGDLRVRKALHKAVLQGIQERPSCRWLLTSRIVGYESMRFDLIEGEHFGVYFDVDDSESAGEKRRIPATWAETRYVSPFDDAQIEQLASNWYTVREKSEVQRRERAKDLVGAIYQNEETHRLARIPNILTFMALIHRVKAQLPHGRAVLYSQIAEAYLQSIDDFRGIREVDYPLSKKKRWLARVAYEMQCRRAGGSSDDSGILVGAQELLKWLEEEMEADGVADPEREAREYVDYIGRRSGLFIPRGEGQYAFVHLSFQEYFAAHYLLRQIASPAFIRDRKLRTGLRRFSRSPLWRETMVFLFESLADGNELWLEELRGLLFGKVVAELSGEQAVLLAALSVDPHSGLNDEQRRSAWRDCWSRVEEEGYSPTGSEIARILISARNAYTPGVWAALVQLSPETLYLMDTGLSDISALSGLTSLQTLYLGGTGVSDISALSGLTGLRTLLLSGTGVSDISALSVLTGLRTLYLWNTAVSDIRALSGLTSLTYLDLSETRVTDISALSGLTSLQTLDLTETRVTDISALSSLTGLHALYLGGTGVSDISALSGLTGLETLLLTNTGVSDISALSVLTGLQTLYLTGTRVKAVPPSLRKVATI